MDTTCEIVAGEKPGTLVLGDSGATISSLSSGGEPGVVHVTTGIGDINVSLSTSGERLFLDGKPLKRPDLLLTSGLVRGKRTISGRENNEAFSHEVSKNVERILSNRLDPEIFVRPSLPERQRTRMLAGEAINV